MGKKNISFINIKQLKIEHCASTNNLYLHVFFTSPIFSVVDPDPTGSKTFCLSGSAIIISADPKSNGMTNVLTDSV
jgi:hypothetical protein